MKLSDIVAFGGLMAIAGATTIPESMGSTTYSTAGIEALARRRLPQHEHSFTFSLSANTESESESYTVTTTHDGRIRVQGTSLSSILYGFHSYLSDVVHVDIWWYAGSQLQDAPPILPKLSSPLEGSSIVPYRYDFNTVTTSYTAAFWTWEDWELQLDWMALRGVNLALAWIGIEKILIEVFQEAGFSNDDIDDFFTGPAFLAWNHFGNLQGSWSASLSFEWVEDQYALQKKIVKRMVELGITPILPAFPGFLPRAAPRVLPGAQLLHGVQWAGFPDNHTEDTFLDPVDPLFSHMQQSFITKQQQAYGNVTSFYALDQFNEMTPPSNDVAYLRNVSSNTWKALKSADPDAIWVFQAWLFAQNTTFWNNERIEAYLGGVTTDSDMLILDIWSESMPQWQRAQSYYGKPWIWCELQNYGATVNLYGQIQNVTLSPILALEDSTSLSGFGLSMEGQQNNEIVYDLLLAQAWNREPIDTEVYFRNWAAARYSSGQRPASIYDAWETSIIELVPRISNMADITGILGTKLPIPNIINIYSMPNQTTASRIKRLEAQGEHLTELLLSLDLVLSSNKSFRLSTWLSAARSSAPSPGYADSFEYEARNQITLWGPSGQLIDYASKPWSGLMKTYHLKRWQMFVEYLIVTEPGQYNQTEFQEQLLVWELSWVNNTGGQIEEPDGKLKVQEIIAETVEQWVEIFT
ncbi:hypothetical protein TgHK011_000030 [Trichoderma gracile]|nr:hypothetical protein TgHK011_000030 [Trichoderma gracile]